MALGKSLNARGSGPVAPARPRRNFPAKYVWPFPLTGLWDVFRDLPTIGQAKAVGITKAVKLVTGGRTSPSLDSLVRKNLGVWEPETTEQWIDVLQQVAADLHRFESRTGRRLEDLVDQQWRPVAVGRAFDMVFDPKGTPGG